LSYQRVADKTSPPSITRQAGKLELGHSVERKLGQGQSDLFTVDARAGQFPHVVADRDGVDITLQAAIGNPLCTV